MLASANMQNLWVEGPHPSKRALLKFGISILVPSLLLASLGHSAFPGREDCPVVGFPWQAQQGAAGRGGQEGQLLQGKAAQTGKADSQFHQGYATLELEGWMSRCIQGLQDNLGIR